MRAARFAAMLLAATLAVWSDSASAWTRVLPPPEGAHGRLRVAPLPNGDVAVVSAQLQALRLAGDTGKPRWSETLLPAAYRATLALAPDGDLIVGGSSSTQSIVVKLSVTTGAERWRQTQAPTIVNAINTTVPVDAVGDVFVTGDPDFGTRLVKLSGTDGSTIWQHPFGFVNNDEGFNALAVDAAGDVIAAGAYRNGTAKLEFVAVKLSGVDGHEIWRASLSDPQRPGFVGEVACSVVATADGDVIVSGSASYAVDQPNWQIVRLAGADGAERWRQLDIVPDSTVPIVLDGAGDVISPGRGLKKRSGLDGSVIWSTDVVGMAVVQSGGDVVVGGDGALSRVSAETGAVIWSGGIGSLRGWLYGEDDSIALNSNGDPIVGFGGWRSPEPFTGRRTAAAVGVSDRLTGARLQVKDVAGQRALMWSTKDPKVMGFLDGFTAGAALEISNPTSGETTSIPLPAPYWSAKPITQPGAASFSYRDSSNAAGPCRAVDVRSGRLIKAKCLGTFGFSLDEAAQGSLVVRLKAAATGFTYCTQFGGQVVADRPGLFDAKNAPAPATCP